MQSLSGSSRKNGHGAGGKQTTVSGTRFEAYDASAVGTGSGLLIALIFHLAFLTFAYLRPLPSSNHRSTPIEMEMLTRPKPPPEVPPPPPPVSPPPAIANRHPASRPLPRELIPVPRKDEVSNPQSPALVVPAQPPQTAETSAPGPQKGPIDLFPQKTLGGIVGVPAAGAPIPKGPDRLFKDERLDPKKEAPFELIAEKGGGYKCETKNFIAHIKSDGSISFDNRFPIGLEKGGTFSFDLTDLAMRSKKQDPYAAEKRRVLEFTDKVRNDLRKNSLQESRAQALNSLSEEIARIWSGHRSAAARRHELYEKWADCADDKEDHLGRKGRQLVEDYIRGHLSAGSSDAFTAEELAKIASERQGLPPFDPYGTGTP